jgi:acyl transferase domain-containing protein
MEPAREELEAAIEATTFATPSCPVYQNVTATAFLHQKRLRKPDYTINRSSKIAISTANDC